MVTLPDQLLDLLVDFRDEAVHDVLLERKFVFGGVDAHEVLGPLAEQVLGADLQVHLDGGGGDGALREGHVTRSGEAAGGAALERRGHVEEVQVGVLLDAGLEADAPTGLGADQGEVLQQDLAVVLHIRGQRADDEVFVCHS